jgi:uncharacterized phage-associated protein
MYSVYSLPRQCSEHQILVNEEIDAWEGGPVAVGVR